MIYRTKLLNRLLTHFNIEGLEIFLAESQTNSRSLAYIFNDMI